VAAAAVVIAAAGGTELGTHLGQTDSGPYAGPALAAWTTAQGDSAIGGHAIVLYRPMGWGTQLAVQVSGLPVHTPCTIEAVERNGATVVSGSWTTDDNEGHVWYPASLGAPVRSVAALVITVAGHPASAIRVPL
jgi:hypothetical protein